MTSLSRYYEITSVLFQKEFTARYKRTVLGYLWSIANPIAHAVLFYFVFDLVAKIQIDKFPLFLVTGLFPWQFTSNTLATSAGAFIENKEIIKRVAFPRFLINISSILQNMFHFILSIPVILIFLMLYDYQLSFWYLLGIPVLCFLHSLLCFSFHIACSALNVFFRDLENLVRIALMFLFYLTPVVYTVDMVPEKYAYLINLNPMSPIIISWRKLFLEYDIHHQYLYFSILWILILGTASYLIYKKLAWRFAEGL